MGWGEYLNIQTLLAPLAHQPDLPRVTPRHPASRPVYELNLYKKYQHVAKDSTKFNINLDIHNNNIVLNINITKIHKIVIKK